MYYRSMSTRITLRLTPARLEVLYLALRRAYLYEDEMVSIEPRHAAEHKTKASIYRALASTITAQTDIPPPSAP